MNETKAIDLLKQHSEQFVNHNKKQITRVYPRGSRVDSSNYMPLVSWLTGLLQFIVTNFFLVKKIANFDMQIFDIKQKLNFKKKSWE